MLRLVGIFSKSKEAKKYYGKLLLCKTFNWILDKVLKDCEQWKVGNYEKVSLEFMSKIKVK